MKINRALYLGHYLRQLNREKFFLYLNYSKDLTGRSGISLLSDILKSVFTYNISLLEYFQFHFYKLSKQERELWAGTGYMYEYQLRMNPRYSRHILQNKALFYKHYADYFIHQVVDIDSLRNKAEVADSLLINPSGKLVFKPVDGNCGIDIEIGKCEDFDRHSLLEYMDENGYGLVEEYIEQHPDLNRLSPSAVNTVRVFTQLNGQGGVDILGCRLRISVNSPVDNMAAGNLAAPIDEKTGRLSGPGVYSDITRPEQEYHPVTGVKIAGFQIPYWEETLEMVKKAALRHPQNRSIGWDIAITKKGPDLIEANHDWCKLVWQLPVKMGLKSILEDYK